MIDKFLKYMQEKDIKILIKTDIQISNYELNVIVVKILSWIKLEYKRSLWQAEGKKTSSKPLEIDTNHPWGANLQRLIEKEEVFSHYFIIKDGHLHFSNKITEEEKTIALKKVYENYNPQKHT